MRFAAGAIFTALLSLGFTGMVRATAHRLGIVAAPRQDRWHRRPTALLGGIAIFLAFLAGSSFFVTEYRRFWPVLLGASLLFLVGLIDDLLQLKPYIKLGLQIIASTLVVLGDLYLPWTGIEPLNYLITLLWLVGITNAINLLDNMDGLAGGISLIACLFLAINFMLNGQAGLAILPLLLGGAIFGFLCYNFSPASIFMGDCGSMFLGFMLGGMALLSDASRARNITAVLLTPVLIFLIPIFDTTVVTVARKLSGRPVSHGGRDHTSHRLVALGMSERKAVIMLYLFAAASGGLALFVRGMKIELTILLVTGCALLILFLGLYLGMVRVYEQNDAPHGALVGVITGFPYRRRIFELMLDFVLIVLAYYSSYLLRFDGDLPAEQFRIFVRTLPLVIAIELFLLLAGGVYRGIWRYVGVDELVAIVKSVFAATLVSGAAVFVWYGFRGPSRAVFIVNGLLLLMMIAATRLSFRLFTALLVGKKEQAPDSKRVVIYGAGDRGEILIRELVSHHADVYHPIGFIDDDAGKIGRLLRGYKIFHSRELPELIDKHGVREVLISSGNVPESQVEEMRTLGLSLKWLRIQIE